MEDTWYNKESDQLQLLHGSTKIKAFWSLNNNSYLVIGGLWSPNILLPELFDHLIYFILAVNRPMCTGRSSPSQSRTCGRVQHSLLLFKMQKSLGLTNVFSFAYKHGRLFIENLQNTGTLCENITTSIMQEWWEGCRLVVRNSRPSFQ